MLLAVLTAPSPAPDAYAIFDKARNVWMAQRYPNVVGYTVDVAAASDGADEHRHYHEYWSAADDRVVVKPPVSDEEIDNPYKPSPGVNFMGWNIGGPREGTGVRDFIGVPALSPNYSFGLAPYTPPADLTPAQIVAEIRREYHDPNPQKVDTLAQQSGLKTIALVTSSAHAYKIALVGIEPDAQGQDYHLSLQPLQDPMKYRLRDLWIDVATSEVQRARIAGNFTDKATEGVSWMVRFQHVGGATYIATEEAEHSIVGYHGLMYSDYKVTFSAPARTALPAYAGMTSLDEPLLEP